MKTKNKVLYSFRIHKELLDYMRKRAESNYTTVTQYLIDLIHNDIKNKG